ncbi:MAG: hydroxymethylglutaryl-CoA synthase family protein, partial [Myxococcales bacterium]|nr:hydroxymethylglutaryl-CoA synthase family protein [Myxococcales bacterium]
MIGIHRLAAYVGSAALDLGELARARNRDPHEVCDTLLADERTVLAPWEDPVTQAVAAARRVLDPATTERVRWLLVATESSLDEEKPLSSWVHHWLGLPTTCRNLEVKHACYGGTGALRLLQAWLAAEGGPQDLALLVTTDLSLLGLQEPHESVLGAGATALLLSHDPDLVALEPASAAGVFAREVTDVIRPTPWLETGSSETSLFAYLDAVDGTFDAWEALHGPIDVDADFRAQVYHAPFGGITARAHERALLRAHPEWSRRRCREHFERRVAPALTVHRRVGGVYAGSTFLSLLGQLLAHPELRPGDPMGVFSYGSGSCAELYRCHLGPHPDRVDDPRERLASRRSLDVATYERWERERSERRGLASWRPQE